MKRIVVSLVVSSSMAWAADMPPSAAQCQACHGAQGEGNVTMKAPQLAAQSSAYLTRQLDAYADGTRANPIMTPIAQGLSPDDRRALASYFAALVPLKQKAAKSTANARGLSLAIRGDDGKGLQACANCHGPKGAGEAPNYPYLAGQGRDYLVSSLHAWRDGSRKTDASQQMPMIAKRLSDADIDAIASYYATLPSPAPVVTSAPRTPPPPSASSNAGTSSTPSGVGTEQGAPTTGGAQGPGGGGATRANGAQ